MQLEIVLLIAMWQPATDRWPLLLSEADALRAEGKHGAAEAVYRRILEESAGGDVDEQMPAWIGLTVSLLDMGRAKEAEEAGRKTLELCKGRTPCSAFAWNNLAGAMAGLGRWDEAEKAYREALRIGEASLGLEHGEVLQMWSNLGVLLASRGEGARAVPILRRAMSRMPNDAALMSRGNHNVGAIYMEMGEYVQAETYLSEARRLAREAWKPGHPMRAACSGSMALLAIYRRRLDVAEKYLDEADIEASAGPRNEEVLIPLESYRALMLESRGKYAEAIAVEEALLRRQVQLMPGSHPALLANVDTYGRLLNKNKDREGRARVEKWRKALVSGNEKKVLCPFKP